jgi:hypothetical protein
MGGRMSGEVSAGPAPQDRQRHEGGRSEGVSAPRAAANKWIGRSVTRLEDPPLVRGRGRFADIGRAINPALVKG